MEYTYVEDRENRRVTVVDHRNAQVWKFLIGQAMTRNGETPPDTMIAVCQMAEDKGSIRSIYDETGDAAVSLHYQVTIALAMAKCHGAADAMMRLKKEWEQLNGEVGDDH